MAYDSGIAEILRLDLAHVSDVTEKAMFGGLGIMVHGNMICAVHGTGGVMFRVGKVLEAKALAMNGVVPMEMRGRPMGGWVDTSDAVIGDDAQRAALIGMALEFVRTLPPK